MRHTTRTVCGCGDRGTRRCSLHLESAPLPGGPETSAIPVSPGSGALRLPRPRHAETTHEEPGLAEGGDLGGLRSLLALLDVEGHALALVEALVPAALDCGVVHEHVRAA